MCDLQAAKPKHSPLPEMPPPVTPAQMPGATATEQPGGALGETEDVKEIRLLRLALIDANVVFGITNDTQWHQVYADVLDRALRANPMPPLVAPDLPEATEQAGGGADAADGLRRMAEEHEVGDALAGVDLEPDATRPSFAAQAGAVERAVQRMPLHWGDHQPQYKTDERAALSAAAASLRAVPRVVEALNGTLKLLREAQDVLVGYLVPDGYDADKAVSALLELLDGPHQREIEGNARAALRRLAGQE